MVSIKIIIMLITIGFDPSANDWAQDSLANVFTPMSRFFIASMITYTPPKIDTN